MDAYWFITTSPTKMSWTFCTKIILTILNNSLNSLNISRWICLLGFFYLPRLRKCQVFILLPWLSSLLNISRWICLLFSISLACQSLNYYYEERRLPAETNILIGLWREEFEYVGAVTPGHDCIFVTHYHIPISAQSVTRYSTRPAVSVSAPME